MLRVVVICPNQTLREEIRGALLGTGAAAIVRELEDYPGELELSRVLRAHAPDALLLSFESPMGAGAVAAAVEAKFPGLQIVGAHREANPEAMLCAIHAGVREFLTPPFSAEALTATVERVGKLAEKRGPYFTSTDRFYAFIPSKPGAGASTIALNTSIALAKECGGRALLADFDIYSGSVGFMLNAESPFSILDAAEHSARLDEDLWPQLVSSSGKLDVLTSGPLRAGASIEPSQVRRLVEFARRQYQVICADLSGGLFEFELEVLREAKKILLVCTPEIASLRLAREKLGLLRGQELEEKVLLVASRMSKRPELPAAEIEKLLGRPVFMEIPNDYAAACRALKRGIPVPEMAERFAVLASKLANPDPAASKARKRMVTYFSLAPARYTLASTGQ